MELHSLREDFKSECEYSQLFFIESQTLIRLPAPGTLCVQHVATVVIQFLRPIDVEELLRDHIPIWQAVALIQSPFVIEILRKNKRGTGTRQTKTKNGGTECE